MKKTMTILTMLGLLFGSVLSTEAQVLPKVRPGKDVVSYFDRIEQATFVVDAVQFPEEQRVSMTLYVVSIQDSTSYLKVRLQSSNTFDVQWDTVTFRGDHGRYTFKLSVDADDKVVSASSTRYHEYIDFRPDSEWLGAIRQISRLHPVSVRLSNANDTSRGSILYDLKVQDIQHVIMMLDALDKSQMK